MLYFHLDHEDNHHLLQELESRDDKIRTLVAKYPNDMTLGAKIRKMFGNL